jgi:hypothetical protein
VADDILDDPAGHFPYAMDRAEQAGVPAAVVGWCAHVVAAQEAARLDPSPETAQALQDAMRAAQAFNRHRRTMQANPPGEGDVVARPSTVSGNSEVQ